MVAGGVLGDRFGIRRVLLIGLAAMLVSSLVAASATTLEVLVVGTIGLALSTAVVVPLSLAAVMGTFGQRVLPVAIAVPAMAGLLFEASGRGRGSRPPSW